MTGRRHGVWAGLIVLAGCAPQAPVEVVTDPVLPRAEPISTTALEDGSAVNLTTAPDTVLVENSGGLVERLPNTCKLENYQQYEGQNASVLASAPLDRAYRVVGPDTIVSQEYDPSRLNFNTNSVGVIRSISCG